MSALRLTDEEKEEVRVTLAGLFCARTESGCWTRVPWPNQGRPILFLQGKNVAARRASYASAIGDVPDDQIVSPACRNDQCINPAHLFLETPLEKRERERAPRAFPLAYSGQRAACEDRALPRGNAVRLAFPASFCQTRGDRK